MKVRGLEKLTEKERWTTAKKVESIFGKYISKIDTYSSRFELLNDINLDIKHYLSGLSREDFEIKNIKENNKILKEKYGSALISFLV